MLLVMRNAVMQDIGQPRRGARLHLQMIKGNDSRVAVPPRGSCQILLGARLHPHLTREMSAERLCQKDNSAVTAGSARLHLHRFVEQVRQFGAQDAVLSAAFPLVLLRRRFRSFPRRRICGC